MSLDLYLKRPDANEYTGIARSDGTWVTRTELCRLLNDDNIEIDTLITNEYDYENHVFNITHNLGEMAAHVGVLDDPEDLSLTLYDVMWRPDEHLEEIGGNTAKDLLPFYEVAKERMSDEDGFAHWLRQHFTPKNGWGSFDGLMRAVCEGIAEFKRYPDYIVYASR